MPVSARLIVLLCSIGSVSAYGWALGAFFGVILYGLDRRGDALVGLVAGTILAAAAFRANRRYLNELVASEEADRSVPEKGDPGGRAERR
jgi:hypothetical protein